MRLRSRVKPPIPIYSLIVNPEIAASPTSRARCSACRCRSTRSRYPCASCWRSRAWATPIIRSRNWSARRCASTASSAENAMPCRSASRRISLAVGQGFRRLGLSTEAVGSFQFQVVAARRSFAQANKDAVVRFVRALGAAFRFIRDGANRGDVTKAIVELTGVVGRNRAADARALFRARPRRDAEAGRDQSCGSCPGDRVHGRGRHRSSRRCLRRRGSWTCSICAPQAWSDA